jgi:hypothetical protein
MTERNIPPIETAWKVVEGLIEWINEFIEIVNGFKKKAERVNDWAEYHKCIGQIDAYENILKIIKNLNIKQKE